MLELLQNTTFQWIVGICVTLLIGGATLLAPRFLNRKRKILWYRAYSYPLVERGGRDERIEISFDGTPVPNVYMSAIGLWYQGTESIVETDYRTPVTFNFENAQILDAEVVSTTPEGIQSSLSVEESSRVVFTPTAMNNDNVVTARVLATSRKRPKITGHIVGVDEIKDIREHRTFPDRLVNVLFALMFSGLALLTMSLIFALFFSPNLENLDAPFTLWLGFALLSIGFIMLIPAMFLAIRLSDRRPILKELPRNLSVSENHPDEISMDRTIRGWVEFGARLAKSQSCETTVRLLGG